MACVAMQGETWSHFRLLQVRRLKFQLVDVHGERITVKATFELLPVRRPILSLSRLVDKGLAVVMGNDQGKKLSKNGRERHLHKSNGVCHVRASRCRSCVHWEDQGKCHTRLATCHSEFGPHTA